MERIATVNLQKRIKKSGKKKRIHSWEFSFPTFNLQEGGFEINSQQLS